MDIDETERQRLSFTFVGTTNKTIDLDPAEFRGRTVPAIIGDVLKVLADIAPDVSFFPQEIAEAANELANAAG